MKIEIRSPLRIEGHPKVMDLVAEAKRATEKDLKPKIKLANRIRLRMGAQLHKLASDLLKEEDKR
jgi:hypothetical protein